jgi:translin
LKEMLERMRKHFDAQEKIREEVLDASREVIRSSARAIAAVHRNDRAGSDEMFVKARETLATLADAVKAEPHLTDSGTIISAYQEYCESALVRSLIWGGKLLTAEELDVPYKAYLAALADVTGELRRHALDMIRADDVSEAERMLKLMEEIFEMMMEFDYPDVALPGMRRRQDMVRRIIEITRGDLTTAIRQQKLENELKRAERSRD